MGPFSTWLVDFVFFFLDFDGVILTCRHIVVFWMFVIKLDFPIENIVSFPVVPFVLESVEHCAR